MSERKHLTKDEIRVKYNLSENMLLDLMLLKSQFEEERELIIQLEDLIQLLKKLMNCDEMNIWLARHQLVGDVPTLEETLRKFLNLKTSDEIISLYDSFQNSNEDNISNVRKSLIEEEKPKTFGLILK